MIQLHKPTLKRKDMDAVLSSMVDEAISPGARNREFALALKKCFNSEECVVLRSYVRAFELACELLHLHEGSKVVISPLSPVWYIQILKRFNCTILLADVEPHTGCISYDSLRRLLSEGISAIIIYSPFGNLPDYEKFANITIPILEDLSQGFGSRREGLQAAPNASMIITAFEEESVITTGGGAALLLQERKYYKELQTLLGNTEKLELLPDLNASLGIAQLKVMDQLLERRYEYLELLINALKQSRHRVLLERSESCIPNGYTLPVQIDSRVQEVKKFIQRYKIEAVNPFAENVLDLLDGTYRQDMVPNSAQFMLRTLCFPLYPLLSRDQLKSLVKVLTTLP